MFPCFPIRKIQSKTNSFAIQMYVLDLDERQKQHCLADLSLTWMEQTWGSRWVEGHCSKINYALMLKHILKWFYLITPKHFIFHLKRNAMLSISFVEESMTLVTIDQWTFLKSSFWYFKMKARRWVFLLKKKLLFSCSIKQNISFVSVCNAHYHICSHPAGSQSGAAA